MVGTTKRYLRKVLGRSEVEEEELHIILVGIEAALNSWPIIQDDDNDIPIYSAFLSK